MFRKTTYLSFILALALTGCSDDIESGNVFVPDGSVSFGTYIGNANSRASVVDASTLQSSTDGFGVMAYVTGSDSYNSATKPNYMFNQRVVYGDGSWNYSPLKYWPASADEKISFFAYAPYVDVAASPDASESCITSLPRADVACDPVIKYEFGSDISKHIDLLYASATDKTNADGTVNFEFSHALSRIGFKVCGWEDDGSGIDFDDNTTVTINAITLSTVRHGASLNLCTGEWSESVSGDVQAFTLTGEHLQNNVISPTDGAKQLNTEDGYMMIVPDDFIDDEASKRYCMLVDYTVETIDPNLLSGKLVVRNKVYRYLSPTFQSGKAYTINIHLSMTDNLGSSDDGTDAVGPAPIDPNPEDPTVPSTGGKNSYVKFSTTVVDWVNGDSLDIPLAPSTPDAPEATFSANQLNLHITGSFSYVNPSEAPDPDTFTILSMIKEGTADNILKGEQSFTGGSFSIPTSNIYLGKMESDVKYVLTLRNTNGDLYKTDITMSFGMMQMTIDIPFAGDAFTMPLKTGSTPTKMAFVWGDEAQTGELSNITTTNNTRSFQASGIKEIKILSARPNSTTQAQINEFNVYRYSSDSRSLLVSVDTPILRSDVIDFQYTFFDCQNLRRVSSDLFILYPDTEIFSYTFSKCTALESIPSDIFANNINAKRISDTFSYCTSLSAIPQGLFDNCLDVHTLSSVFSYCSNITEIPAELFKYNVNLKRIGGAFLETSISSIPSGLLKTNDLITHCTNLFGGTSITSIPKGLFDKCTELYDIQNCFNGCTNLSYIPNNLFKYCPSLYTVTGLFSKCTSISYVPADIFKNCLSLYIVDSLFRGCTNLEQIPEDVFSDCVSLRSVGGTFYQCTSITSIPEGLFRNNVNLSSIFEAFQKCTSLTDVPKTLFDNNPSITSASYLFKECSSITSEVPELWNRSEVKNFTEAYSGCVNAANYADIPSNWK